MVLKVPKVTRWVRILFGAGLIFFGINGLFGIFTEMPAMTPEATAFMTALFATGYMFQLLGLTFLVVGGMYVFNRGAPLGTLMIFPVSLNIVLFHLFLDMRGMLVALVLFVVNLYLVWAYSDKYLTLCGK